MLKFYADESQDPETSLLFASGLLMTEPQAIALEAEVAYILGPLPYFHMREGHAKQYPDLYEKLKKLILKGRVMFGVSGSIKESEHKAILSQRVNGQKLSTLMGKPYTYLMGHTMRTASTATDFLRLGSSVKIEYIFEAGHANQGDADFFWSQLSSGRFPDMAAYYRYGGHRFVNGKGPDGRILQLCDLFCWHVRKNVLAGEPLKALGDEFRIPILTVHHEAEHIAASVMAAFDSWENYAH